MNSGKREFTRMELLSGIEPSADLEERFRKQREDIVRRRLTKAEIARDVICALVFIPTSGFFAYAVYLAATAGELPETVRWLMYVSFGAGSLAFLIGALYAILEIRGLRIAPRSHQQAILAVSAGLVLIYSTFWLVLWRQFQLPVTNSIRAGTSLLFYWIMAVGFVLEGKSRWRHEDSLLEQKRTQLEIALLREEISKKK